MGVPLAKHQIEQITDCKPIAWSHAEKAFD